jgi:hypothetical protein
MKISGFSMARNATKLYYPVKESIESVLSIVDEFVIAVGKGDPDDRTREQIESINSPKVKIIDTVWDLEKYPKGMEHAHQTDIAKEACNGDWLIYLQADEVVHEDDLQNIKENCKKYLHDKEVEGMLLNYLHFFGDYNHYIKAHGWYKKEVRVIRNDPDIHSWRSAQPFRRIPNFDGINYRQKEGTYKLQVVPIKARIFHYGWVRPPHLMKKKMKAFSVNHRGKAETEKRFDDLNFDYGPLNKLKKFKGTHPAVMNSKIEEFNWQDELYYSGTYPKTRRKLKHETFKNKLISWIENNLLGGKTIGGAKNWILLKRKK